MSREVKRVALDFDWYDNGVWPGYLISSCTTVDGDCDKCKLYYKAIGKGEDGCSDGNQAEHIEPLEGPGWQMWETTSEGSPMSPVFETPEELARWLADTRASTFGSSVATYDQWLGMINAGWSPSAVMTPETGLISGVEACQISEPTVK